MSLLFMGNSPPFGYATILFILTSVDVWVLILDYINNAATNIHALSFLRICALISLDYTLTSGISGSYGPFLFNSLRNCQTILQSGCTIVQSHSEHTGLPTSPHSH